MVRIPGPFIDRVVRVEESAREGSAVASHLWSQLFQIFAKPVDCLASSIVKSEVLHHSSTVQRQNLGRAAQCLLERADVVQGAREENEIEGTAGEIRPRDVTRIDSAGSRFEDRVEGAIHCKNSMTSGSKMRSQLA